MKLPSSAFATVLVFCAFSSLSFASWKIVKIPQVDEKFIVFDTADGVVKGDAHGFSDGDYAHGKALIRMKNTPGVQVAGGEVDVEAISTKSHTYLPDPGLPVGEVEYFGRAKAEYFILTDEADLDSKGYVSPVEARIRAILDGSVSEAIASVGTSTSTLEMYGDFSESTEKTIGAIKCPVLNFKLEHYSRVRAGVTTDKGSPVFSLGYYSDGGGARAEGVGVNEDWQISLLSLQSCP